MITGADLGGGVCGEDWVASYTLLEKQDIKQLKKVVNIVLEIKANSLDMYVIIKFLLCGIACILVKRFSNSF